MSHVHQAGQVEFEFKELFISNDTFNYLIGYKDCITDKICTVYQSISPCFNSLNTGFNYLWGGLSRAVTCLAPISLTVKEKVSVLNYAVKDVIIENSPLIVGIIINRTQEALNQ